jgi:hypothetical protein
MPEWDPNATIVRLKRRIVPRDQWKSRASDWSALALAFIAFWQGLLALLPAKVWAYAPEWAAWAIPTALAVGGYIAKFIRQRLAIDQEADK